MSPRRLEEIDAELAMHRHAIVDLKAERAAALRGRCKALTSRNVWRTLGIKRRAFVELVARLHRAGDPRVLKIGKTYVVPDPASVFGGASTANEATTRAAPPANDTAALPAWDEEAALRRAGYEPPGSP